MAIVINGSGTITGVSVGGLPDGSVDSDTLATGIDATKLADGTVTSTELQYINTLSSNAQTQISGVGGAWNYIATATASNSASLEFTANIDGTYTCYGFYLNNIFPATAGGSLYLSVSSDGGSSYLTTGCDALSLGYGGDGASHIESSSDANQFALCHNQHNSSCGGVSGWVYVTDPNDSGVYTSFQWLLSYHSNVSTPIGGFTHGGGIRDTAEDINAIKFHEESGNITTGEIRLYGLADS